jgi:hypothetical protein
MFKQKLLILLTFCIILNYFGEVLNGVPMLFSPIIFLAFRNILYSIASFLLLLSYLYLFLSSLLYPYSNNKIWVKIIVCFYILLLVPSFLMLPFFPKLAIWRFLISCIPFFTYIIFLIKNELKTN